MAIKGNTSAGIQQLGASSADTVLHNVANRTAITAFVIQNNFGANATVEIYSSPDGTSAAGELVADYTIADGESVHVEEVIGQGYAANRRIIAVVTTSSVLAGDLVSQITYTLYTGDS